MKRIKDGQLKNSLKKFLKLIMKETNKLFFKIIILLLFFTLKAQAESKILSVGSSDAKVTVKVFSSLTCPHCASLKKFLKN